MISLADFQTLRLAQFLEGPLTALADWEYLGRTWVGESLGFSEWLRPVDDAEHLGCLSLDLAGLPEPCVAAVLVRLDLPLRPAMTLDQVVEALGPPMRMEVFVAGRATYTFEAGSLDRFVVSSTILADGGLTYLVIAPRGRGLEG